MNIKQIADYIISHHAKTDREWLTDSLLLALKELYNMDELTALELEPQIKDRVKVLLKNYVAVCRERQVPPRIRLLNDVVIGNERPEIMDHFLEVIRKIEPFEFQRLCCIYIKEHMGYSIEAVNRRNGGADIIAKLDVSIVAQARRHLEKTVGRDELYKWAIQAKDHFHGAAFLFLTATLFSKQASSYARETFIKLVDGEQIAYFLFKTSIQRHEISGWLTKKCYECTTSRCDLKPR